MAGIRGRAAIEAAIGAEDTVLEECLRLLNERVPLTDWPETSCQALLGALWDHGDGRSIEDQKARDLRWHLFRGRPSPAPRPEFARLTTAERVRADLMGLVKLGAGTYLSLL